MPTASVTSPITPPSASISRTRCPLAMPPIAGLQDICAIRSMFIVTMAVRRPMRAQARAASQPACPAPTTITSYEFGIDIINCIAMNILVIGSGGREHALAWRLAQERIKPLCATPGNPGIATSRDAPSGDGAPQTLLAAAQSIAADLTVVGPEAPLVAGVVDVFRAAGLRIVGPTAAAAQLEGSKIFAKQFFRAHQDSDRRFVTAENRGEPWKRWRAFDYPVVVKADGLAAGKGVVIAPDRAAAEQAIRSLGGRLVIEEFLTGEEVSFIALTDGRNVVPLAPAQDHKAVFDGDTGPEHRRHGRLLRFAHSHPAGERANPRHDHSPYCRSHRVHGIPLRRPDDDRRRSESFSSTTSGWATRRRSRSCTVCEAISRRF